MSNIITGSVLYSRELSYLANDVCGFIKMSESHRKGQLVSKEARMPGVDELQAREL